MAAKSLYRQYPIAFPLALIIVGIGTGSVIYVTYIYMTYIAPINHRFPEPVANKLRRAIYYSNTEVNPHKAVSYYKQALALADEHGMDAFSDEIIGIKLTLAAMLENIGQHMKAIEVLEIVRSDCQRWLEAHDLSEDRLGDRTRILSKTVGMSIKLGELYSNPYVDDLAAAERNLVEGVETCLREERRREKEGDRPGEGKWMSPEEIGGALEALADHYEQKSQHVLAAPLYLRAVTLSSPSCHATVLMNNLAISLAQTLPASSTTAPTSRPALISSARSWANKALEIAAGIKPPERSEECDIGCVVATHNLGEFAEMENLVEEARVKYEEARSLSRAIGFNEGVHKADKGLQRLDGARA